MPAERFTGSELGLLALCVLLARNAVLRARELYADARSFSWHRDTAGLARVLGGLSPIPRWRRLLSPHPAPSRRRRLVEDTDEMFRAGAWDAFGIGLSAGLAGLFLEFLMMGLFNSAMSLLPPAATVLVPLVAALVLTIVVPVVVVVTMAAGAMAVGTWRGAFLALMRGRRRAPTFRTAAACAAGGVVGWVSPNFVAVLIAAAAGGTHSDHVQFGPVSPWLLALAGVAFCALLILALALALAAFLAWVEVTARCWLAASLPGVSPGPAFVLGLSLCLLAAVPWVVFVPVVVGGRFSALQDGGAFGPLTAVWYGSTAAQFFPLNLVAWSGVVAFWAFPLSAALWPRSRTSASWAFLGAAPPGTPELPSVPFRLRRAVLHGVAGGVSAVLAATWLRLLVPATSLGGFGPPETEALLRVSSRLLVGVAAQGFVAVLAALAVPGLAVPHAMCAAFVTGGLFAVSEVLHLHASLDGRVSFSDAAAIVLPFVLFGGALVALACAAAARLLSAPVRRLLARARRRRPDCGRTRPPKGARLEPFL